MVVSQGLVRASRIMAWLSAAAVIIVPAGTVLIFLFPDQTRILGMHESLNHYGDLLSSGVPLSNRLFALAFALIPAGIATWGLIALTRLLLLFARGEVFTPHSLRALSRITAALFWNVLSAFATEAPISYFLTRANPSGHRFMELTLGSDDANILFLAGVAFVVARVMAEARRMADEHASFI